MRRAYHWPPPVGHLHVTLWKYLTYLFSSLVTTLRVAEKFDIEHLSSAEVAPLIDAAKFFYVEGYFLTHGTDVVVQVAKKASEAGKVKALYPHLVVL